MDRINGGGDVESFNHFWLQVLLVKRVERQWLFAPYFFVRNGRIERFSLYLELF